MFLRIFVAFVGCSLITLNASALEILECQKVPNDFNGTDTCSPAASDSREPIQTTFQELGRELSDLTRRVDRVIVSDDFSGSLMIQANIDWSLGSVKGYRFILSKRALKRGRDLAAFLNWKESLFLGPNGTPFAPRFLVALPQSQFPTLYYGILHELGHMVWYEFGVDRILCADPLVSEQPYLKAAVILDQFLQTHPQKQGRDLDCEYSTSSFKSISWERSPLFDRNNLMSSKRLPNQDVAELAKICFYDCTEPQPWNQDEILRLYHQLFDRTSFTSVYSGYRKPEEDFAESFAFRYLALNRSNRYVMELSDHSRLDLMAKARSPIFKAKADLIDSILAKIIEQKNQPVTSGR